MGVAGVKPTPRSKSHTSAYVAGTSPGCIGRKFLIAGRPNAGSSSSISRSSSTGVWLPML